MAAVLTRIVVAAVLFSIVEPLDARRQAADGSVVAWSARK
jgi:hypothetical protein